MANNLRMKRIDNDTVDLIVSVSIIENELGSKIEDLISGREEVSRDRLQTFSDKLINKVNVNMFSKDEAIGDAKLSLAYMGGHEAFIRVQRIHEEECREELEKYEADNNKISSVPIDENTVIADDGAILQYKYCILFNTMGELLQNLKALSASVELEGIYDYEGHYALAISPLNKNKALVSDFWLVMSIMEERLSLMCDKSGIRKLMKEI